MTWTLIYSIIKSHKFNNFATISDLETESIYLHRKPLNYQKLVNKPCKIIQSFKQTEKQNSKNCNINENRMQHSPFIR